MHSPMNMYETEAKDRVSSYHWQTKPVHSEKPMQDRKARTWLDEMQSGLRAALSRPIPAPSTMSRISKPPAPQEQCC